MEQAIQKMTYDEIVDFLKKNYDKGCTCPACGQFVKLYKRKFNSGMAMALMILNALHREAGDYKKYFHFQNELASEGISPTNLEYNKLAYWNLIESQPKHPDDTSKKTSGYWRITEKGRKFANNEGVISSHVFMYNGTIDGYSENYITLDNAFQNKFDYRELMNASMKDFEGFISELTTPKPINPN